MDPAPRVIMAKVRTQFLCNHCGSVHPKWMGKCPDCGTWDSLEQYKAPTADARAASRTPGGQTGDLAKGGEALTLAQIDEAEAPRRPTGIGEFDRILGGGVVPGSAVLVGGEPGIGKSTLLLQVAHELARGGERGRPGDQETRRPGDKETGRQGDRETGRQGEKDKGKAWRPPPPLPVSRSPCLLVSLSLPPPLASSTSPAKNPPDRPSSVRGGSASNSPDLLVLAETNVERIVNQIHKVQPGRRGDRLDPDDLQAGHARPPRGRSRSCATAAWNWSTSPRRAGRL